MTGSMSTSIPEREIYQISLECVVSSRVNDERVGLNLLAGMKFETCRSFPAITEMFVHEALIKGTTCWASIWLDIE